VDVQLRATAISNQQSNPWHLSKYTGQLCGYVNPYEVEHDLNPVIFPRPLVATTTTANPPPNVSSNLGGDQSSGELFVDSAASRICSCSSSKTFGGDDSSLRDTPASTHLKSSAPTKTSNEALSSALGHTCPLCGERFEKRYMLR